MIVAGIGCRRGAAAPDIEAAIRAALDARWDQGSRSDCDRDQHGKAGRARDRSCRGEAWSAHQTDSACRAQSRRRARGNAIRSCPGALRRAIARRGRGFGGGGAFGAAHRCASCRRRGDLRARRLGGRAMTVHFIGAGPGAADLITVRGRDLIARCPVCLYAGSIVPRDLFSFCPPGARIIDTAPLSLDEIEAEFAAAHAAGPRRGAAAFRRPCRSTRRSPSSCAGSIGATFPIRSRPACRLSPPRRRPAMRTHRAGTGAKRRAHARARPRLAHAGSRKPRHFCRQRRDARHPSRRSTRSTASSEELTPFYGADCPAAVVAQASSPAQRVIRGTLADIAAKLLQARIERTALILVGRALAARDFRDSALYDADYRRRFRGGAA